VSAYIEEVQHYGGFLKWELYDYRPLIYDYPEVPHEVVIKRMFEGLKPFRNDTDKPDVGYRDFLLWCSVVSLLLADSSTRVMFVTGNYKDFCADASGNQLAPDLVADLTSYGIDSARVSCFRSRSELRAALNRRADPFAAAFLEADPTWYMRFRDTILAEAINRVWNAQPKHHEGEPGPRIYDMRDPSFIVCAIKKKLCGVLVEGRSYYEWDWHFGNPEQRDSDNGDYSWVRILMGLSREIRWIEVDGVRVRGPFAPAQSARQESS